MYTFTKLVQCTLYSVHSHVPLARGNYKWQSTDHVITADYMRTDKHWRIADRPQAISNFGSNLLPDR